MIETEEQRRWWFATDPEYSWSRTGQKSRKHAEEDEGSEKVSPEDVDAYVDDALKHATGTVADFLGIVKKWFGTKGESQASDAESDPSGWDTEAGGKTGRPGPRGTNPRRGLEIFDRLPMTPPRRRAADTIERELERAGANARDYRLNSFAGQHVAERDSLFDNDQVDPHGRTNVQRMRQGLAPLDRNGDEIVLHHADQKGEGPIIEMTKSEHQSIPVRQRPSDINRPDFSGFRRTYWRARAASIRNPDPELFYIRRRY